MTEAERIALEHISRKGFATAGEVGRSIYDRRTKPGGSFLVSVGATVLARLRKRGLAFVVASMWSITPAGIKALEGE